MTANRPDTLDHIGNAVLSVILGLFGWGVGLLSCMPGTGCGPPDYTIPLLGWGLASATIWVILTYVARGDAASRRPERPLEDWS